MSGGMKALSLEQDDVIKMLSSSTHIGSTNCDYQMKQYTFKRREDGVYIINLKKTWEKLLLAARAIVAVKNPADVYAISSRPYGQRAVLKFAAATGTNPVAGRFTPGTFTNQAQKAFREPSLLIITDPRVDHQPITEASYVNVPVIAFSSTDCPCRLIDIVIPCNNKAPRAIGLMWWMLAREVLRLRGDISRQLPWEVMPDLYFFREAEEQQKEEQAEIAVDPQQLPYGGEPEQAFGMQEQWGGGPLPGGEPETPIVLEPTQVPTFIQSTTVIPRGKLDWAETMETNGTHVPVGASASNQDDGWGGSAATWNP